MDLLPVIAGRAAGIISVIAFLPYVISVIRGRTRPSLATWLIWTVVGSVLCASHWASGGRASIWVPVSYALGPLVTSLLALRYGDRGWTRFERGCLAVAALSLVVWAISGNPLLALCMNIFIDFMGALPTMRKSWSDPGSEDRLSWGMFAAGNALNLFAVSPWTFSGAIYPVYLFFMTLIINSLLWRPRRRAESAPAAASSGTSASP